MVSAVRKRLAALVPADGLEPPFSRPKRDVLPLDEAGICYNS